ncbi:MAG: hypothetical protein DMG57_14120 [Acidobacteria bacterium]|nr:MAG: hypothetical protein DMG57_14120 [Acidobacteriota bacterium]
MYTSRQSRTGILACSLLLALVPDPIHGQRTPAERAQSLIKQGRAQDALHILLDLRRAQPSNANLCQQIRNRIYAIA